MRTRNRLLYTIIGLITLLSICLAIVAFWINQRGPNVHSPEFAHEKAEEFLTNSGPDIAEESGYKLINVQGPIDDWLLITIAILDPSLGDQFGTSGLIGIGRIENNQWEFRLQGQDETFDRWLDQLPNDLLEGGLRGHFRTFDQEQPNTSPFESRGGKLLSEPTFYLPYPNGKKYTLTALPGDFHHKGAINNAIDIGMPEGFEIAATTEGRVIGIRDDSNIGGCNESHANDANYIRIKTAPNESILYLHTQVNSIAAQGIKVDDKVKTGQIIARSGSTGFTCNFAGTGPGAHLHIVREKWCNNKICGSLPLIFKVFGPNDPRRGVDYTSENLSPQQRAANKAREERERQQNEIKEIKTAVDRFHSVYRCSIVKSCDESQVMGSWVTSGLFGELFPSISFCFGCPEKWDESELTENEFLPFSAPKTTKTQVKASEIWGTTLRGETFTHYNIVIHYLEKEGGEWKVDGWKIDCGYTVDEDGEIVESIELGDCPLQPPSGPLQ